jgi:hypothetical protein
MLNDSEWNHWSDVEIAKHCGVGHDLVRRARETILAQARKYEEAPELKTRTFIRRKTVKPKTMLRRRRPIPDLG